MLRNRGFLEQFLNTLNGKTVDDHKQDFKIVNRLPCLEVLIQKKYSIHGSKMRYDNIHCIDSTRYRLVGYSEAKNFLHANIVDGGNVRYFAAQGPLWNTINDWYKMIWDENVNVVIMLCKLTENDAPKCHKYYPDAGVLSFGIFTVRSRESHVSTFTDKPGTPESFKYIPLEIRNRLQPGTTKTVHHFQYTTWPDMGTPQDAEAIARMIKAAKSKFDGKNVAVHCSAGVGRTRCIILAMMLYDKITDGTMTTVPERYLAVQGFGQYYFAQLILLELLENDDLIPSEMKTKIAAIKKKYLSQHRTLQSQN